VLSERLTQDVLGFQLREHLYFDDQVEGASWLSVTSQVHIIAVMQDGTGQNGRLHHLAYWLDNREDVLRAVDILTDAEATIEAGPGKHGITQAFFIYLLEPGGNRIKLFSGGYQIFAPDWEPITWTKDEIEKSIIWCSLPDTFKMRGENQRKQGAKGRERTPKEGPGEQRKRKGVRPFKK
jgi:catechol 2,3-dioxygenase